VRPLHSSGGTRREDSSLHLLDPESVDHQRSGTVRRADHRDAGIPAGQDDPSCLPRLSLPGRVCRKTRPAGQHRRTGPLLPICTRRYHHHCMGARKHTGSSQGWVGVYNDCVGSVSHKWTNRPPSPASPGKRSLKRPAMSAPSARALALRPECPTAGALDASQWRSGSGVLSR
jgi:hypothetical protein